MSSAQSRSRTSVLLAGVLGIALTCVSYALFRGLGHDHVLHGIPALIMLVLLSLNTIRPSQAHGFCCFIAGVAGAALVLRVTVGTPL